MFELYITDTSYLQNWYITIYYLLFCIFYLHKNRNHRQPRPNQLNQLQLQLQTIYTKQNETKITQQTTNKTQKNSTLNIQTSEEDIDEIRFDFDVDSLDSPDADRLMTSSYVIYSVDAARWLVGRKETEKGGEESDSGDLGERESSAEEGEREERE